MTDSDSKNDPPRTLRFDNAIERLLQDKSPKELAAGLEESEARLLQMAQLLRGRSTEAGPDPKFAGSLRSKVTKSRGISRRTAVVSGLGAIAAGVVAGIGLDHELRPDTVASTTYGNHEPPLIGKKGHWANVANVAEVPEGSVKSFTVGAVAGYLYHKHGKYHARSRICTHMGCLLHHEHRRDRLVCPCHGAEFGLYGEMLKYPEGHGQQLRRLPLLKVRRKGESIQVWTA
ncbi:MAG TPA: Rieske 2Fe-2S domain-containing protein [Chloroflexota bacterium]|jgi:nitrite reductase/ring-hydroxylating ferredoxin subunit|nr:Rieske 2Fe-2S domain-containing protein [Chloroflexota bacterium]